MLAWLQQKAKASGNQRDEDTFLSQPLPLVSRGETLAGELYLDEDKN